MQCLWKRWNSKELQMKYDEDAEQFRLSNGLEIFKLRIDDTRKMLDPPKIEILCKRGLFREPTQEERKEIAEYMIHLWKEWEK